jgi:asparagine synthase (glutamine-hydrolysing)
MSAIGGIHHFDGAMPDRGALQILERTFEAREGHSGTSTLHKSTAMVFRGVVTNQESAGELQPLVGPGGELLVWDGRLDNRGDLISQCSKELKRIESTGLVSKQSPRSSLGRAERPRVEDFFRGPGDGTLVLAAFLKWGSDTFSRLIGDYALAFWDPSTRDLCLARDPFGARPMYYHAGGARVVWSSEIEPLVTILGKPDRLDEAFVAGFLTVTDRVGHTPYAGISSVAPGQVIGIGERGCKIVSQWAPEPNRELTYQNDREYEDHFRQLFEQAIACRLRVNGGIMAELSGGLDSSSIVCVADRLIKAGRVQAAELQTVSYLYDGSPTCDERTFISEVEERRGKPGRHLLDQDILGPLLRGRAGPLPNPQQLFPETFAQVLSLMQQSGMKVLLSGHAGDNVLLNAPTISPSVTDLVSKAKLVRAANLLRAFAHTSKEPYVELAWRGVIWPYLPDGMKVRLAPTYLQLPPWINPDLVRKTGTREHKVLWGDTVFKKASKRFLHNLIKNGAAVAGAGYYRERGIAEVTYPFLDRPLVEFLLSIPSEQLVRPGETRSLLRRALEGLLPDPIRVRRSKRGPDECIFRAVQREWHGLSKIFANAQIYARGYVDADAFREALQRARYGLVPHTPSFLRAMALESWLRTHQASGERQALPAKQFPGIAGQND